MEFLPTTLIDHDIEFVGVAAQSGGKLLFEGPAAPALAVLVLDTDGAAWRVSETRALPDGSYAWATLEPEDQA